MTLMYRARQGEITPEIARAAKDERVEPEKLRAQIAAGRAVICKNKVRRDIRPVPVGEGLGFGGKGGGAGLCRAGEGAEGKAGKAVKPGHGCL